MSTYLTFSLITVALVIGIIGGFFASGKSAGSSTMSSSAESKLQQVIMNSDENTDVYTDQNYLSEMIMHHSDAVEMSKRVLAHTSRKEVRELAIGIIEAQTKEIAQMKVWLQEWQ